jgi:phage-related protein
VKGLDSIQLLLEFVASHGVRETVAWRPPEER